MQRGTIRIERPARARHPVPGLGGEARGRASAAARSPWFETATRIGFVARALIYGLVGVLALELALGSGGAATNQKGALEVMVRQPLGDALVVALALGFGAYALWRFVQAWVGSGPEGGGGRSAFKRLSALGSGIAYAVLCATAVSVLLGSRGSGKSAPHRAAAGVLSWPAGRWIVGLIGVGIVGIGLYQGYRGITRRFLEEDKTEEMGPRTRTWIARAGTVGHLARAVVFGLIGAFAGRRGVPLQPARDDRARRRARPPAACRLRRRAARDRRRGARRLRRLLARRGPLPAALATRPARGLSAA